MSSRLDIREGDARVVLKTLADCSVASIVTDPPYSLQTINKRFAKVGRNDKTWSSSGPHQRTARGFMGKTWDTGETAFDPAFWTDAWRVLKPGGHCLAFGGTRTYHRLVCAIEDGGFEIRDTIGWLFGAGFPKSHNTSKKLDATHSRCSCDTMREMRDGVSPASVSRSAEPGGLLQPVMPSEGARGAVDSFCGEQFGKEEPQEGQPRRKQSSVEGRRNAAASSGKLPERALREVPGGSSDDGEARRLHNGASAGNGAVGGARADAQGDGTPHQPQAAEQRADESGTVAGQSKSQAGGAWEVCGGCGKPIIPDGLGTALKPAMELIVVARKPLIGTVAENVLAHGTGALNVDACRIGTGEDLNGGAYAEVGGRSVSNSLHADTGMNVPGKTVGKAFVPPVGRWPANVVHDGSEEVLAAFPQTASGTGAVKKDTGAGWQANAYGKESRPVGTPNVEYGDAGSAARFFYNTRSGEASADRRYTEQGTTNFAALPGARRPGEAPSRLFYSAKADAADRLQSKHPTVKPVDLMRWLVRLVTPPGGLVLDPFAGSGTTGMACMAEGFDCILVEREAEYVADIRRRLAHVSGADTPLFSAHDAGSK